MEIFFKVVYDIVFVIQLIAVSLSLIILFAPKKLTKKNILSMAIGFVLIYGLGTLLNALTFAFFKNFRMFTSASFTTAYLLLTVIVFFCVREEKRPKAIMLIIFLATEVIITEFGAQLMRLLESSTGARLEWISIVSYIFIVIFAILQRYMTVCRFKSIPFQAELLAFGISAISIIIIRYYTIYSTYNDIIIASSFALTVMGSLYFVCILTYLLIYYLCKERETVIELLAENVSLDSDKAMMRISQQTYNDIRAIKHDIKNQYTIMGMLLKEEKYDELQKYFEDLGNTMAFSLYKIDCGNEKFNSVLNMEIAKARAVNIQINTNLIVPPSLNFHGSDICGILANAIDNAIDYLHHADMDEKEKKINVDILPKGDFLYIGVSNKVVGMEDTDHPNLHTSKEDTPSHGIGHRIIRRLAKKYNGYANFTIEKSMFITEIMIDMKYKE